MKAGWQTKRLGDLSDLITKGTTPTSVGYEFVPEGVNFVKVESLSESGQFIDNKLAHISQECHTSLRRSQLRVGDILFSIAGALGRTAFVTEDILPANTNQALAIVRLRKSNEVSPAFILTALASGVVVEQIEKFRGGVAQQNLSLAQLQDFNIPLPPLTEQHRLVALLDEAFDGIATAKAHAEKNLQNARALFDSHLEAVFSQRGEGWVEETFSDVCEISSAFVDPRHSQYLDMLHVGGANIESKTGELKELKTAREEGLVSGKFSFDPEVVLYSKIRPYLMKVARPDFQGLCSADMYPLSVKMDRLDRDYLFYLLLSPGFTEYANAGSARAGMPKINRDHLFAFRVFLPPVLKQRKFATELDAIREETQRLEALYRQKLAALEELKKALLFQAFAGEL